MKPRKTTYVIHRWIGLITCLQLLAWSTGGFLFSVLPIDNVRGERDIKSARFKPIDAAAVETLPEAVRRHATLLHSQNSNLATISLQDRGLGLAWVLRNIDGEFIARLDAVTGNPLPKLTVEEARSIAMRDFAHTAMVKNVELIDDDPPTEYRNGVLPAFVVTLDHPKRPHIYIDAHTGEVTARRNRSWRIFDFFWMLHTMDYAGRDNFNHLLLTMFSVLAIATSGSGLALWGWRALPRVRPMRSRVPM